MTLSDTRDLTLLGSSAPATIGAAALETFPSPPGCGEVRFTGDELVSRCPLTDQTDIYRFTIAYVPAGRCLESKALKLYLAGLRDEPGHFAEALAVRLRDDLVAALDREGGRPDRLDVTLVQNVRGGLQLTVSASHPVGGAR